MCKAKKSLDTKSSNTLLSLHNFNHSRFYLLNFNPHQPNNKSTMRFTQTFFAVTALAAVSFADDNGPCDDQNDNGVVCSNGVPVSSNGVALNANTATITTTNAASTTSLGSRISLISSTDTDIIVLTTQSVVVDTTSLPHSLDTRTSTNLNTIVQTLESVYTTNTLGNSASSSSSSRVVATTTNTVTTGTAAGASAASTSASATGNLAALQTAGKFAPFGVAVAALGFAAAL
ncbi:hypothetical protein E4T46_09562 [Aureobasidium subglaciale]|nr:hypothetical protein E4T40_09070 [Aureobasidium subglaciale]KAI5253331.1 hypothetical protein E4T46_09562 [Aureobasidium subglaciale]